MITLQEIRDHSPCRSGWEKVLSANGGVNADERSIKAIDMAWLHSECRVSDEELADAAAESTR